jgi:hypothetical protein
MSTCTCSMRRLALPCVACTPGQPGDPAFQGVLAELRSRVDSAHDSQATLTCTSKNIQLKTSVDLTVETGAVGEKLRESRSFRVGATKEMQTFELVQALLATYDSLSTPPETQE